MIRNELTYRISDSVFRQFPDYIRGVVFAEGVTNTSKHLEITDLLRAAEREVRTSQSAGSIGLDPRIEVWRNAYRTFGAKPSKYHPSVEALTRRVVNGNQLPSINPLVDIGNLVSIRHCVPAGGHATDVLRSGLELRHATGSEAFVPFSSTSVEHPDPGEVIFADGSTVVARRWTWRQANHTLTLPETTTIEFNVDGLPPVTREKIEEICNELAELIRRYCGGRTRIEILSEHNPSTRIFR
jgi:DNA/RNA-binding domain of Phe-tRNA-synthetase-like protein